MTCAATPARPSPCPPAAMPHSARLRSIPLAGPIGTLELVSVAASAPKPKRLVLLAGADHFFAGQLEPMQRALFGWLKEQLP